MSSNLEKLCRPILTCVCDYWQYTRTGNVPDKDIFLRQINLLMVEAKESASKSPILEREFARMERPLVFFVDYMVKEGGFPFAGEWREMARKYNELSGDEKFFDLLADALDDPDSSDSLELFYTMLGLGFDGIHRNDPAYIERRMKVCASRFSKSKFDVSNEALTPIDPEKRGKSVEKEPSFFRSVRFVLLLCTVFMTVAFGINLSAFLDATKEYRHALSSATENAIPKTMRANKKNKQLEQIEQSEPVNQSEQVEQSEPDEQSEPVEKPEPVKKNTMFKQPVTLQKTVAVRQFKKIRLPEQIKQPEPTEQPEQVKQPEQTEQPEQAKQPEQTEQPDQAEQSEQTEQPEQAEQPEQTEQPEQAKQPEQTEQPEQAEQSEQTEQPEQTGESEKSKKAEE